ncbi:tRNA1(Val) (adenine(37)-N6)-methyltransferase [Labilibacter marinus]|uniref:tRNA1(Val) (adenine(37)-N6)-methyltransferase n=1 Tax=Labilibacter marinus TaxID=1477105 RepID=UPI00082DBB57|nr:methyltransferase [Labilibacter marinus]
MANNYFKFKQFIVQQDLAAMKVGTDGVLIGAWASADKACNILDIGTGTGLIALMMAQKNAEAKIDAIEIDEKACEQAKINFIGSPWSQRLNIIESSLQAFKSNYKYDLIISNPPYFNNSLKNDCKQRQTARHTDSLTFSDLLEGVHRLLNKEGRFCVVLPTDEKENFVEIAQAHNLFLNKLLDMYPTPTKPSKRVLMEFSFQQKELEEEGMILEEFGRHLYSDKFKQLTGDFYLGFKSKPEDA